MATNLITELCRSLCPGITQEETDELNRYPIEMNPKLEDFTPEQIVIRKNIAKKIWDKFLDGAGSAKSSTHSSFRACPKWAIKLYTHYPPWKLFLRSTDPTWENGVSHIPVRLNGFILETDIKDAMGIDTQPPFTDASTVKAKIVISGLGYRNNANEIVNIGSLIEVEDWTDEQKEFLKATPTPGLYLDPLSFILFLFSSK